ncbi:hypothetical protein BHM03_00026340 [Ensete ventricosum]|uniref:Uncharacterized protein n=1 Tax=Ensete ventricosum TaxID=4639 RepID=A0A426WZ37_ENSVE|nr:hypothetical protein B296_00058274 [Ensete ventricosum]RZR97187.1 hypothetical protein BHM03_00026340 [Ensete ventricosum]
MAANRSSDPLFYSSGAPYAPPAKYLPPYGRSFCLRGWFAVRSLAGKPTEGRRRERNG